MTIQQIIKDLEELNKDYYENMRDLTIKRETRKYFQGKYRGIKTAISYLKLIQEK